VNAWRAPTCGSCQRSNICGAVATPAITRAPARSTGRRPKSAKARSRGQLGTGRAASAIEIDAGADLDDGRDASPTPSACLRAGEVGRVQEAFWRALGAHQRAVGGVDGIGLSEIAAGVAPAHRMSALSLPLPRTATNESNDMMRPGGSKHFLSTVSRVRFACPRSVRLSPEAEAYFERKGCEVLLKPRPEAIQLFNRSRAKRIGLLRAAPLRQRSPTRWD
jgi:hypothetical protein